ncbi:VOC family protein [Candidatus Woesearchaeota archaeon]|nr:VOC family protein [Candidatus Woesearchaeota archaeon]
MLGKNSVSCMVPVVDMDRAKEFYVETLGLKYLREELKMMMMLEGGNNFVFTLYKREPTTADHTIATFMVDDIIKSVSDLKSKGVTFIDYDTDFIKTTDSIATIEGKKAAWFKDTENNILGLYQAT